MRLAAEANELVRPIHNRMPVILPREHEDFWLHSKIDDQRRLLDLLVPYAS
jgi:putative SOS response-associated peptidase YedK